MTAPGAESPQAAPWWRSAVFYEVYLRSFADSDGDGVGDLPGLRSRLPYLADLGVDALWITPFYPSPLADAGYDVANYRDVDARYGGLTAFDDVLTDAHALGLRVTIDIVPNHTSDQHPWFHAALAAEAASGIGTCFATAADRAATSRRTIGSRSSVARPGPGCRPAPTGGPVSGTCTCSPPSSPT